MVLIQHRLDASLLLAVTQVEDLEVGLPEIERVFWLDVIVRDVLRVEVGRGLRDLLVGLGYPEQVRAVLDFEIMEVTNTQLHRQRAPYLQTRHEAAGVLLVVIVSDDVFVGEVLVLDELVLVLDLLAAVVMDVVFLVLDSARRMLRVLDRKFVLRSIQVAKVFGVTCVDGCIRARCYRKAIVALLLHLYLLQNLGCFALSKQKCQFFFLIFIIIIIFRVNIRPIKIFSSAPIYTCPHAQNTRHDCNIRHVETSAGGN